MISKELISVIVPIYNVEENLERCLESILNQTYTNMEIILVDDGSPDRCGEICDIYLKKDNRVRVIHKQNGGLSDARNAGLNIAKGKYIGFVDSDDYIELEMYESLISAIQKENAMIACCGIIREYENGNQLIIRTPNKSKTYTSVQAIKQCLYQDEIGVSVWCKLFDRNIFKELRFPVGETNEDAAILLETLEKGKLVHTGKALYHYMIRDNSITATFSETKNAFIYKNAKHIQKKIDANYKTLSCTAKAYLAYCLLGILLMYPRNYSSDTYNTYVMQYKKVWPYIYLMSGLSLKRKIRATVLWIKLFCCR